MPPSLSCPLADTSVYMWVGTADFWCSKILWQSKKGFRECIIIHNGLGFQSILGALGALYSKNSSIVLTHNVRKRARRRWWKQKGQSIQCDKGFPFSDTHFTHWTQVRSPSECDSVKAVRSTSTEEVADLERAGQIQGYDLRAPISSKGLPNIQVFQQSKQLGLYKKNWSISKYFLPLTNVLRGLNNTLCGMWAMCYNISPGLQVEQTNRQVLPLLPWPLLPRSTVTSISNMYGCLSTPPLTIWALPTEPHFHCLNSYRISA